MKAFIWFLAITIVVATSIGCKKELLDVKNENSYTDVTYFKSQKQFNEAVIATYAVFNNGGMMSREWYFIFDLLGNDADKAQPLVGTELELADYTFNNNNEDISMLWASLYRMIFRSNLALYVMDKWLPESETDKELKKQYIAEAHWLRGVAYFYLVTNWGRVPVKLSYDDAHNNSTPRSTVEEIWNIIENEFKQSIPGLPVAYPSTDKGRATKGAAIGFLGKSYLYQKKYDSARVELEKLTISPYSYELDPNFNHLFSDDNINSPEIVFAVNHVYTTANTQYYMFGGWEGSDGRTAHTGRAQEYGFNDWQNVVASDALVGSYKYNNPVSGASYVDPRAKYTYYSNAANGGDVDYCNSCSGGTIPYPYDLFGNSFRKYEPYEVQKFTEAPMSGINTIVMRYADILLMLAECNIDGTSPDIKKGIKYINDVRNRQDVMAVNYPLTLSQNEAQMALRRERRIELAGEQSRWFDLIRWGIAKEVLKAEKPAGQGQQSFQDKMILFPIPSAEIDANSAVATDVSNDWN